jgi:hypothetical protein
MWNLLICTPHQILLGCSIRLNDDHTDTVTFLFKASLRENKFEY